MRGLRSVVMALMLAQSAMAQVKLLKDTRAELTIANQPDEEKQLIADQAFVLLDSMYVHRELKIKDFGAEADPIPRLKELRLVAAEVPAAKVHRELESIFRNLHDLHTSYSLPKPIACRVVVLPLAFSNVQDQGREVIAVSGLRMTLNRFPGGEKIKVGDRLVSANGVAISTVMAGLAKLSGGANPSAMNSRAAELLSLRPLSSSDVPETDSLNLELTHRDGAKDTVALPWLVVSDSECLQGDQDGAPAARELSRAFTDASDPYQKLYNRLNQLDDPSQNDDAPPDAATQLEDKIFTTSVLSTPAGKIGYLNILSFATGEFSTSNLVESIKRRLEIDFADTVGLIIDVRDNPGGNVTFAERLIQLFVPTAVEPENTTMMANELNYNVFADANGGLENRWSGGLREAINRRERYIRPIPITNPREANEIGQGWFRATIVLTNANCYSACDIFSAGMQDHKGAIIVGEDLTTGAGGANVVSHQVFQKVLAGHSGSPFEPLPAGQDIRVAWRQSIRTGLNRGRYIEDRGVISDRVAPRLLEDLTSGPRGMMKEVRRILAEAVPHFQSSIARVKDEALVFKNGEKAVWEEQVRGIDRLEVRSHQQLVKNYPVALTSEPKPLEINFGNSRLSWHYQRVELIGFRAGAVVFRVIRPIRWVGEYTTLNSGGHINIRFDNGQTVPLVVDVEHGTGSEGWRVVGDTLRIGTGPMYGNDVHALSYLPLELSNVSKLRLSFRLALNSEYMSDVFRIHLVNVATGVRNEITAKSGQEESDAAMNFDVPIDGDGRYDLLFEFESDENWNMSGPVLSDINVSAE